MFVFLFYDLSVNKVFGRNLQKKIHFTHVIGTKKDERLQICKITTTFMSLDRLNTHRIV